MVQFSSAFCGYRRYLTIFEEVNGERREQSIWSAGSGAREWPICTCRRSKTRSTCPAISSDGLRVCAEAVLI